MVLHAGTNPFGDAGVTAGGVLFGGPTGLPITNSGSFFWDNTKLALKPKNIWVTGTDPWADAKGYGCVGDGVTDDSANFQSTINASTRTVHVSQGTYLIKSILTLPDRDLEFIFDLGAKIITTGLGANPLFKVSGLTAERHYKFINLTATGENTNNAQYLLQIADTGGFPKFEFHNLWITNFRRVFNFSNGDTTQKQSERVLIYGGKIVPPTSDATSILITTTAAYAANSFPSSVQCNGTKLFEEIAQNNGWNFNCDSELIIANCRLDLAGANAISGFSIAAESQIFGVSAALASIKAAGGSDVATLGGAKVWLSDIEFILDDEAVLAGAILFSRAKITCLGTHGLKMALGEIVQSTTAPGGNPDFPIDIRTNILASVNGAALTRATGALIKNASTSGVIIANANLSAGAGVNTLLDSGAGATYLHSCVGLGTGLGPSIGTGTTYLVPNGVNLGVLTTTAARHFEILDATNPQLRLTQADASKYADLQANSNGYLLLSPSGSRVGINIAPTLALHVFASAGYNAIFESGGGGSAIKIKGGGAGEKLWGLGDNIDSAGTFSIANLTDNHTAIRFYATSITTPPSVVLGDTALATTATDGFLYIAGGAGAPTGVPTSFTGRFPFYYDSTNHKIWVYDSGWKGVVVA